MSTDSRSTSSVYDRRLVPHKYKHSTKEADLELTQLMIESERSSVTAPFAILESPPSSHVAFSQNLVKSTRWPYCFSTALYH